MRRFAPALAALPGLLLLTGPAHAATPVDFEAEVLPILRRACEDCHGPKKASGGLQLVSGAKLLEGGITGPSLVPGHPDKSYLLQRILGEGDEDRMPLKAPPLGAAETAVIRRWIAEGARIPVKPPQPFRPAPAGMKRLTVVQYKNTLRDLLGDQVPLPGDLEADTMISGSAVVGASRIGMSRRATEQYAAAAFGLARAALGDPAFRQRHLACAEGGRPDAACLERFVDGFGRRALRRPLTADERRRYLGLARSGLEAPGPTVLPFQLVIAALLQSPSFVYRVEIGVPDPTDPSRRLLTDFELASRLAYFLWGAPPDDALLDAAAAGRLSTDEGLRTIATRMLESPRARQTMMTFFTELLRLRRLDRLSQFRSAFKQRSDTLGPAMRTETLKVIEEVAFDPGRDFREIFDARFTYVNAELASLYGVAPPEGDGFVRIATPGPRVGILGHASFLALNAHPTSSSPSKRGKFIREVLLCQAVPPPPPNVSTKLPEDHDEGTRKTTRQKLDVHRTAPQCAGCHKSMDPMGLAFETFDGIGAFRDQENGLPIDTSGELDGIPFKDAGELGALLRKNGRVGVCFARNLLRFALGHLEEEGEEPVIEELAQGLEADGFRFHALVLNVIKSRGFRYVANPE
jgi:mono/diheme cytochrome c family protein